MPDIAEPLKGLQAPKQVMQPSLKGIQTATPERKTKGTIPRNACVYER
jgi:hypothetical protein